MGDNRNNDELAARGSLLAPVIPRSYVAGAETIVPRFMVYARQIFVMLALLFNVYVSVRQISTGTTAEILALVNVICHIAAWFYSLRVILQYIKEGGKTGEIYSRRSIDAYQLLPANVIFSGIATLGIYIWLVYRYVNGQPGWLVFGLIAFMLLNLWIMKARVDTLSFFLSEYYVSGLFRVRYDDVGDLRIASSAMPGLNTKAERRVYFEVYDKDGGYLGRDCMYEDDYKHLETIIKGSVTSDKNLFSKKPEAQEDTNVRHTQKKKKKNPYKKNK